MRVKDTIVSTFVIIILSFNSFYYFNPDLLSNQESDIDQNIIPNIDSPVLKPPDINDDYPISVKKIETPGDYQLRGFFSQDDFIDIDPDGEIIEWRAFSDVKDEGWDSYNLVYHRIDSNYQFSPDLWPNQNDTYYHLKDRDWPYPASAMFSPIFEDETYIDGKVHFLTSLMTDFTSGEGTQIVTIRIRLLLFNSSDSSTSEILSIEDTLPEEMSTQKRTYSSTLSSPVTIPAGFRLKIVYEAKLSNLERTGRMYLIAGDKGYGNLVWNINDGEYSNTYSISETDHMLGVQFKMFDSSYPDISVSGFANNTVYLENKTISIDVSGAVDSSYRWDFGSFTSFDTSTTTDLPFTMGWHNLEIQALDEFNNNKTLIYQIGYDESTINVVLQSPNNNSVIGLGDIIDFDVFSIDYATYEWDLSGSETDLTSPEYQITAPAFSSMHNLTIRTYDDFGTEAYFYVFEFDGTAPLFELINVDDNTQQPAGKSIDVNITDSGGVYQVFYKWDARDNFTWLPFDGTVYRTYLPESAGQHFLYVSAIDNYGNAINRTYRFIANTNFLLVELRNANNDSYYQGGEIIEVTITGSNENIKYEWNSEGELDSLIDAYYYNSTLILNGTNVLPDSPVGEHILTIRTFDVFLVEHIFKFIFTLDQEAPSILTSKDEYNNKRFLNTDVLEFAFDDNLTLLSQLEVSISINDTTNIILAYPYDFDLLSFADGTYNLTVYVYDIANNYAACSYIITIDTLAPSIDILDIEGLIEVHGVYYIPADSLVTISILDDDNQTISTFSWGGIVYTNFTDSFILSFADGSSILYINASDSLGNQVFMTPISLTIDSQDPNAGLNSETITEFIKINEDTTISILVEDLSTETIKTVEYYWDILPDLKGTATLNQYGEFDISGGSVLTLYSTGETAILSIYTEDVVGNNQTYDFSFTIDTEPPTFDTFIYDEDLTQWIEINEINIYNIRGNTKIWFTNISSDYYTSFYYWDTDSDIPINESTWLVYAPSDDGFHNLTIEINDNTGNHTSPNTILKTFHFFIDDIAIDVLDPINLLDLTHQISYKDNFTFTISIYDGIDNSSLSNLIWHSESLNNNLNLIILNNTIDNKTFEFYIYANNIGLTDLIFEFSQLGDNRQSFIVSLDIERKEGKLIVLENNVSVLYGDSFKVNLTLEDDLQNELNVNNISVNGFIVSFQDLGSYVYSFEFYPDDSGLTKGLHELSIIVESDFYFGETNDTFTFNFEVLPLQLLLTLDASNLEIIEGTRVELVATLTYINGTPVDDVLIIFMIYVTYKTDPNLVRAYLVLENLTDTTDASGQASISFEMSEDIEQITFSATYEGNPYLDSILAESEEIVKTIKTPGLASWLLYVIIGGSLAVLALVSFIIYKVTKSTPIEVLMSKISEEDIIIKLTEFCPGAILSIFDQRQGAVPIISDHSLSFEHSGRIALETDNFILKVSDQAFSSLGFEETIQGRRLGSLTLPNESMLGFIHGIQLKDKSARGGLENLVITVLTDLEFGTTLLSYQEFLHPLIDDLQTLLEKKKSLKEIEEQIRLIRHQTVRIILAGYEL